MTYKINISGHWAPRTALLLFALMGVFVALSLNAVQAFAEEDPALVPAVERVAQFADAAAGDATLSASEVAELEALTLAALVALVDPLRDDPTADTESDFDTTSAALFEQLGRNGASLQTLTPTVLYEVLITLNAAIAQVSDSGLESHAPASRSIAVLERVASTIVSRFATDTGRPDHAGRPENTGRPDNAGQPETVGQPENAGRPDDAGQPENVGRSETTGRPETTVETDEVAAAAPATAPQTVSDDKVADQEPAGDLEAANEELVSDQVTVDAGQPEHAGRHADAGRAEDKGRPETAGHADDADEDQDEDEDEDEDENEDKDRGRGR